jgi:hypothetical protein
LIPSNPQELQSSWVKIVRALADIHHVRMKDAKNASIPKRMLGKAGRVEYDDVVV